MVHEQLKHTIYVYKLHVVHFGSGFYCYRDFVGHFTFYNTAENYYQWTKEEQVNHWNPKETDVDVEVGGSRVIMAGDLLRSDFVKHTMTHQMTTISIK